VQIIWALIYIALTLFQVLLILRIVFDVVQMFARSWRPGGVALVALELIYSVTDPPIRTLRRIIPPLRLGGQAIDLSVMFVLLICYVFLFVNRQTLLSY